MGPLHCFPKGATGCIFLPFPCLPSHSHPSLLTLFNNDVNSPSQPVSQTVCLSQSASVCLSHCFSLSLLVCVSVCLSQTVCFSLSVLVCLSVSLSYSSVPIWEIDLQGSTLSSPSHLFPLARCMLNRDPLRQVSYRESLSGPESIPNRGSTFALDGSTRRGRKVQGHFWRRVA